MEIDDTIYVNYIPTIGEVDFSKDGELSTIGSSSSGNYIPQRNEQLNEVRANRGVIGGWTLTNNLLFANNVELSSQGYFQVGTGDNIIRLDSQNASYLMWAGDTDPASAPFSITIDGKINATSGEIGGWIIGATFIGDNATANSCKVLIDSTNTLIRLGATSGNYITLDGENQRIRSSNYVTGVSGFTVEPTLIEAENILARGMMRGATFAYDIVSAIGGQLMVANADTLDVDMTALDNSTLTIKGATTFAVNDNLLMRASTASGIQEEWLRVTNIGSAPTYTVTRDLANGYASNSNPIWLAGTPIVKQGSSDGTSAYSGGWLRLLGEGTNSPYYSVFARTGVAYNAYAEVARMGNLNGFLDYSSDVYGIAMGDADSYVKIDPTNGVRISAFLDVGAGVYGDGSDGAVTVNSGTFSSGPITNNALTRDAYFTTLTIDNTYELDPAGYRIFCSVELTGAGTILRNGNDGSNGSNGDVDEGGAGGAGGAIVADGNLKGAIVGAAGGKGGNAITDASGQKGTVGTVGGTVSNSVGSVGAIGGSGGAGGDAKTTRYGGLGGAGGLGGTRNQYNTKPRYNWNLISVMDYTITGVTPYTTSSGSGGGGGGGGGGAQPCISAGESGGGGGGSASGGGLIAVYAKIISGTLAFQSIGGDGGDGGDGGNKSVSKSPGDGGAGGGGAGGAGGPGGAIFRIYYTLTGTTTTSVVGGSGGTKGTGGTNPGDGDAGDDGNDGATGTAGLVWDFQVSTG